jgi:hypothetical protein
LEVNLLEVELEDLGILLTVKNNTDKIKFIKLNEIKSIFNVLLKQEKEMLISKVYLFK